VLFVQVLCIAKQMTPLKLGTVAWDGTKIHANPRALSYGHAERIEAQLPVEAAEMLARAEAADAAGVWSSKTTTGPTIAYPH